MTDYIKCKYCSTVIYLNEDEDYRGHIIFVVCEKCHEARCESVADMASYRD